MSLAHEGNRAVSPVIAVILMVAIVVVLAAVAGAYVVGFGDESVEPAPNVRFDAVYDDSTSGDGHTLTVTVQGGDTVDVEHLELDVDDAELSNTTPVSLDGDPLAAQMGPELSTADTLELDATTFTPAPGPGEHLDLSDATITLVWDPEPNDGEPGQTQSIWRWDAD